MVKAADTQLWSSRIRDDEAFRDDHLFSMDSMIASAHGPHYTRRAKPVYMPWNFYHSYTSRKVGQLMFDNPRVEVRSRRRTSQQETVEALGHGLNRWIRDTNLRLVGQKLATDFCYSWFVAMVRQVPNEWERRTEERHFWYRGELVIEAEESLWPAVYRIPQTAFFADSEALTFEDCRYMGHTWYEDAGKLLEAARSNKKSGWRADAIAEMGSGGTYMGEAQANDPTRRTRGKESEMHHLELVTVWNADLESEPEDGKGPDDGYHGELRTFAKVPGGSGADKGDWVEVKDPEPYFGPPEGPYVLCGAYTLPNRFYPLSPLIALEANVRAVNRQARAVEKSNEMHKRAVLYNSRNAKAAQAARRALHDWWVPIEGFDRNQFEQAEWGGATETQYRGFMAALEQLSRISGEDDAQQGAVTGIGTATENQIAAAATADRTAFLKQQFSDGMTRILQRVAWFLYHDNRVLFPLGDEVEQEEGQPEVWFQGGDEEPGSGATYKDLEVEIELYSMQRMGQAELVQTTQLAFNYLFQTFPMRVQFPFADWNAMDDMAAKMLGVPNLGKLVDNEAAAQMQPFAEGAPNTQPRLSVDVGGAQGYGAGGPPRMRAPQGVLEQASMGGGAQAGPSMLGAA